MNKKIRTLGTLLVLTLWGVLTSFVWFSPAQETSVSERRSLAQFPTVTGKNILTGKFMQDFEKYSLDQFPARDTFRSVKAVFHTYGLMQQDNNNIYLADGYLAKQEYPLNTGEVTAATNRLNQIYETYLKNTTSRIYCAVIPDKNYYLAENSGRLTMDYTALFSQMETAMPWATHIDITDCLSIEHYYNTDIHWRQETLLPVAKKLCNALGMPTPNPEDFTASPLSQPFYGVYHGQAALPVAPETMYLTESEQLSNCQVSIHNGQHFAPVTYSGVYDTEKLSGKDMYDVYLSGSVSLLQIDNPTASTDRELILFRDSFGSSLAPLLLSEYKTITLVDVRYLESRMLDRYLDFHGQDVLFLYSTSILNNGSMLK